MNGLTVQLYSLRSAHNWGIGDYSDLAQMMAFAGENGLDFVGINPLHALFTARPDYAILGALAPICLFAALPLLLLRNKS